jgi:hypothetical protein
MNFQGTWMLCISDTFDESFSARYIWEGSFMECMTIVAYENLGPLKFDTKKKTIVVLHPLELDQEEEN